VARKVNRNLSKQQKQSTIPNGTGPGAGDCAASSFQIRPSGCCYCPTTRPLLVFENPDHAWATEGLIRRLGGNDDACICDTLQVEEEGKCKLFRVISSVRRDKPLSCHNVGNSLRQFCAFPAYMTGFTSIGCGSLSLSLASQTIINLRGVRAHLRPTPLHS
jgi:hypothetical protein